MIDIYSFTLGVNCLIRLLPYQPFRCGRVCAWNVGRSQHEENKPGYFGRMLDK